MPENERKNRPTRRILVSSDWVTTFGALLLFLICVLLLARDIRNFFRGPLSVPAHFQISFWGIWNKLFQVMAIIYCFIFARSFPKKTAKVACILVGISIACSLSMSFVRLSSSTQHFAAVSRSLLWQISLFVSCVAIADWFRSIVRFSLPLDVQGGNN